MTTKEGYTPLHSAIFRHQMAASKFLVHHGGSDLLLAQNKTIENSSGRSCLHLAVMKEQCELIDLLCSRGGKDLMTLTDAAGQVESEASVFEFAHDTKSRDSLAPLHYCFAHARNI